MTALKSLIDAVISGEEGTAAAAANEALRAGLAIDEIIAAMTAGMREIGDQFARMEIFLPEMVMAAEAMKAAMAELQPEIEKSAQAIEKKGTMVVGTVAGDVHVIGKEIVVRLLRAQGFEVHDLGFNVNALDFVKKAQEVGADIIGASSLMSTTMPAQQEIIEILKAKSVRDDYHVILGGAPVTQDWVAECGADSWGENAASSVEILERVMTERAS